MRLIDLGIFTPAPSSNATAINAPNQIAGVSGDYGVLFHGGAYAPTIIGAGAVPQDMNLFSQSGSFSTQIVGNLQVGPDPVDDTHAFLWDSIGGLKDIHPALLSGGAVVGASTANAVNNLGQIVGRAGQSPSAYLWSPLGGFLNLQPLIDTPGDNKTSMANDINDAGEIVGSVYWSIDEISKGASQVFRLAANGASELLDGQIGDGDPTRINNKGDAVGHFWSGIVTLNPKAFLWTGPGDVFPIPCLGTGEFNDALDVDEQGTVIGWSDTALRVDPADEASGQRHAFMWDGVNGLRDLNALVTPADPSWILSEASAINVYGSIVGYGYLNGVKHAYELRSDTQPYLGSQIAAELSAVIAGIANPARRIPQADRLLPPFHPWGPGDPPPYLIAAILNQIALGVGGTEKREAFTARVTPIVRELLRGRT